MADFPPRTADFPEERRPVFIPVHSADSIMEARRARFPPAEGRASAEASMVAQAEASMVEEVTDDCAAGVVFKSTEET
jgi:hypothetical protein